MPQSEAGELETLELHKAESELKLLQAKVPSSCDVVFCSKSPKKFGILNCLISKPEYGVYLKFLSCFR